MWQHKIFQEHYEVYPLTWDNIEMLAESSRYTEAELVVKLRQAIMENKLAIVVLWRTAKMN